MVFKRIYTAVSLILYQSFYKVKTIDLINQNLKCSIRIIERSSKHEYYYTLYKISSFCNFTRFSEVKI